MVSISQVHTLVLCVRLKVARTIQLCLRHLLKGYLKEKLAQACGETK